MLPETFLGTKTAVQPALFYHFLSHHLEETMKILSALHQQLHLTGPTYSLILRK